MGYDDFKPWNEKIKYIDNNYILFRYFGCKRIGLLHASPTTQYHTSAEVISYVNTNLRATARTITTSNVLNNEFGISVSRYPINVNLGDMNNGRFFYLTWGAGTNTDIKLGMVGTTNVTSVPVFYGHAIII